VVSGAPSANGLAALFSLNGRVAVVTGGSRGIGHALADGLAAAGATVIAVARSAGPDTPFSQSVRYLSVDVALGLEEALAAIAAEHGRLDILVNAAGISLAADPETPGSALDTFDRTINVNLRAAYANCLAASRFMSDGAAIINVTSIGAHSGFPGNPGYVASKGGLRLLTKALAVDLGPRGIRVNALAPGYIHTAMTAGSHADPVRHKQRADHTCLGRWGSVDDLVGAAVFLAGDASRYMTGQDLVIDGGWTAKGLV
jgi:NAD(P)-dependent dehydrogenase (short-subunit alcohol dehydrogenase family)